MNAVGCSCGPNPFKLKKGYCINLDNRTDRWKEFCDDVLSYRKKGWPLPSIERWSACVGKTVENRPPEWWRAGAGAWGCYNSHMDIFKKTIDHSDNGVVIFEDDCGLVSDFSSKLIKFASDFKQKDSDFIMLGGAELGRAVQMDDHTIKMDRLNRTHAIIYPDLKSVKKVYNLLQLDNVPPVNQIGGGHIDHWMAWHTRRGNLNVYAPRDWLCYQRSSKSDINGKTYDRDRKWSVNRLGSRLSDGGMVLAPDTQRVLYLDGSDKWRWAKLSKIQAHENVKVLNYPELASYCKLPPGKKLNASIRQLNIKMNKELQTTDSKLVISHEGCSKLAISNKYKILTQ